MTFCAKYFSELTAEEIYEILKSRCEVFTMEQRIYYLDADDIDYKSLHCFFTDGKRVAAYLRAFYADGEKRTVKLGRVLTLRHGEGLGRRLMEQSLAAIKDKMNCGKICLDAQKQSVGFYEKFGFRVVSGDFIEAGVVHNAMEAEL